MVEDAREHVQYCLESGPYFVESSEPWRTLGHSDAGSSESLKAYRIDDMDKAGSGLGRKIQDFGIKVNGFAPWSPSGSACRVLGEGSPAAYLRKSLSVCRAVR